MIATTDAATCVLLAFIVQLPMYPKDVAADAPRFWERCHTYAHACSFPRPVPLVGLTASFTHCFICFTLTFWKMCGQTASRQPHGPFLLAMLGGFEGGYCFVVNV